jgi:hypothetical protein
MNETTKPCISDRHLFDGIVSLLCKWRSLFLALIVLPLLVSASWAEIPSCEISDYEFRTREVGNIAEPFRSMGLKMVRCYFFGKQDKDDVESIYFQCLFKPKDGKLMPVGMGHVDDLIISRKTPERVYIWRFAFDKDWRVNWANYMEMDGRLVEVASRMDAEDYRHRVEELLKEIFIQINKEPYYEHSI